jgi:hypothetical protein
MPDQFDGLNAALTDRYAADATARRMAQRPALHAVVVPAGSMTTRRGLTVCLVRFCQDAPGAIRCGSRSRSASPPARTQHCASLSPLALLDTRVRTEGAS